MRDLAKNIRLPSIDDLFSTEEERQDAKLEKIQILPLSELHPFEGHPFQVRDDEEMDKMVDSVKEYGVMTPAIVRPRRDGGYEIVAGHRRCHASRRAGVDTIGVVCSKNQSLLKYNRQLEDGCTIRGRFLVCGLSESKMLGLSKEQAERYNRLLFFPQVEDMLSGDLPVAKVRPPDERFGNKISFWERLSR